MIENRAGLSAPGSKAAQAPLPSMTGHIFFWTTQIFIATYLAQSLTRDLGGSGAAVAVFGLCLGLESCPDPRLGLPPRPNRVGVFS